MRRRRNPTLLLLIVLILILMAAALLLLPRLVAAPAPTATPTPPFLQSIVIAAQNIPRGAVITASDVALRGWPVEVLPEGAFTDTGQVIGKIARVDIPRQKPIVPEDLAVAPAEAARWGSEAALFVPPGKVAFAFPVDEAAAVAFNLAPGDRVDVLVTFSLIQTKPLADGEIFYRPLDEDLARRLVALGIDPPAAAQVALVDPNQRVVHRVSQLVLQNVEVLAVGSFEAPQRPQPTPVATPAPGPTPTPAPRPRQQFIVLLVSQQDALVLQWLRESGAVVDFALRNPTDNQIVQTNPVTLNALVERMGISIPPADNFDLAPDVGPGCPDQFAREPCR
ncbi:MAG: Flp pilus assembly protein CpaB [Thermoflexus sp.]|uniref:Flp pilus assembly protein CpaB n=1 Tax=Thermoflexus sp. TaxID=1969742 RepID=UPI0025D2F639|nr:Flp pilus assembly protein CpaB [Thermoflexus sp.]MDW8065857.1 Flp pilus assembly protein CpaB [Anaerolineae bacterium]MCS6964063.1 Flp pilus assembly protein CpaB [Thermoflexus sp.]MCS7351828.1 Flp pilus assembly protein CpaB [Thermoflexus sp.]MDW8181287.1 Flp pilus assembly protein CpaB [Anaerolineae bacterium]MDW8183862.1 Flp pilus assembly protein CpaB [Anaerolineae bacterium]